MTVRLTRSVVFDGRVGGCARVLWLDLPSDRALADAVHVMLSIDDAPARVEALVGWGLGPDERLASEALIWLSSRPDLLAVVDASQRQRLEAAVPDASGPRAYPLSWTLARLHAVSSIPSWIAWLGQPRSAVARPVIDAMQLMTHHRPQGLPPGGVHGAALVAVREDFSAWWATWGGRPVDEALAAGAAALPADDPLSVAVRRSRCEIDARLTETALPDATRRGEAQPACP